MYGCLGTRYLKDDEKLLFKQKIKASREFDNYELGLLLTQRPNRRIPIIRVTPYVWFYQRGIKKYDREALQNEKSSLQTYYDSLIVGTDKNGKKRRYTRKRDRKISKIDLSLKEGNLLMRWGEPLAIHDTNNVTISKNKLKLYLISKGYFNAEITNSIKERGKKIISKYNIVENRPYLIDTIYNVIYDKNIDNLLSERQSKVKVGENYNQQKLTDERNDITYYLKDRGYYDFSRQYIRFDIDSTHGDHQVAIRYVIQNPIKQSSHKKFILDSVNFITDAHINGFSDSLRNVENYNRINYKYYERLYKPKILDRRVFLYPDSLYNRSKTIDTQRQLANLDVFKFININYDSTGGNFIANIFTRPLPRYQWTNEVGVNVTQGFPGPFYNTTFKKRNIFRGMENFEISGRIGIEGVTSASDVNETYTSFETGLNAALIFPQFVMPFSKQLHARIGSQNPKTRFSVGYSLTDRPEYRRNNVNFTAKYTWQRKENMFFSLSAADISIINSQLDSTFRARLKVLESNGSNLIKSFNPSFVSSISLQANRSFNNYGSGKNKAAYLRFLAESGGVSHFIVDQKLYEERNLETYQFLKFNIDFRRTQPLINQSTIAFRYHAGVAIPYGANQALPYEKYFFAGGSNGIRGWRPRRLGPGSFNHLDENGVLSYQAEQQGEILIEASLELRQKLFGFLDWAFFIDAGNIWTMNEEESRPGANFEGKRFYKEIAVASGLGLRLDFSFLIIRFDAGLKVYDPARVEGKRFILIDGYNDAPFDDPQKTEPVILNIGIGYPF